MTYTTTEAARRLGLARRTILKWCAELGVEKHGPAYIIDDEALGRIGEVAQDRRGRPSRRTD